MSEPSWGLWGSWEETEQYLGKVVGKSVGPDPVEQGSIRRWLEPKEFASTIHTEAGAAHDAGYKDIVAPASMVFTYGIAAYWNPGDAAAKIDDEPTQIQIPVIFDVPAPCDKSFATSIEVEFFEPLYPGDVVTCTSKLVDIKHKELRVGKGAFLRQEDTYTKQSGEVVAVSYLDIFRFVASSGEAKS
ncbi:MAG: MaoC family dehydratase N-terminal domain-containing protein [Halieaceae bacterium]